MVAGELLSKAFALALFDEFRQKKGYDIPRREPKGREKVILDKIEHAGIRKALREVERSPEHTCEGDKLIASSLGEDLIDSLIIF